MSSHLVSSFLNPDTIAAERARRSFALFVRDAWSVIEPGTPFVDGFHLQAIAAHLQAVSEGHIKRLLINMPPRHGKSTLISVLWPVWSWLSDPSIRWLCGSYAMNLATRDNLKCRRVIKSPWFQQRYGHIFTLTKDQDAKIKFENNKTGYRQAVSVGSSATGEGGDILLCLCYNAEVTTDKGRLRIGDIVEKQLPVRVLAFDHSSGTARWQRIEKYEKNPGRPCVRVTLNDGRTIDATADHPFYVVGRGYVPASQLTNTDKVITDDRYLRELRQRVQSNSFSYGKVQARVLQQGMPYGVESKTDSIVRMRTLWENNKQKSLLFSNSSASFLWQVLSRRLAGDTIQHVHMRSMWKRVQASTEACCTCQPSVLQSYMSWNMGEGAEQSSVSGWQNRASVRVLSKALLSQSRGSKTEQGELLLSGLPVSISQGNAISDFSQHFRQVRLLRQRDENYQTQSREEEFLLTGMRQQSTQRLYQRQEQWKIYRWRWGRTLFLGLSQVSAINSRTRWAKMQTLSDDKRGKWQRARRSSHRLRQRSQSCFQSGFSLPLVPREDAWIRRSETPVEGLLVRCVESIPIPEQVYNLRIVEDHNYFANGVLVHNCDDPHNIDEKESSAKREAALDWFSNTWSTRLNSQVDGAMVVVGQRIHEQDVSGHILENNDGEWVHLNLPAEYESASACKTYLPNGTKFWEDPRKEDGQLLWEKRFPQEVIEKAKRRHGMQAYGALYQQNPTSPSGMTFNQKHERLFTQSLDTYFLHTPRGIRAVAKEDCTLFLSIDPAISEEQSADYMVIGLLAKTEQKDLLLLDIARGRWPHNEQQEEVEDVFTESQAEFAAVETVAYQHALFQDLVAKGIPCRPFKPHKDKVSRASTASIWQANGKIYFLKNAPWLPDFQKEVYKFPKTRHDDQVDMLSLASVVVRSRGPLSDASDYDDDIPDPIEGPLSPEQEERPKEIPLTQPLRGNERDEIAPVVVSSKKPVDVFEYATSKWGEDW